jgi:hypothetical protein
MIDGTFAWVLFYGTAWSGDPRARQILDETLDSYEVEDGDGELLTLVFYLARDGIYDAIETDEGKKLFFRKNHWVESPKLIGKIDKTVDYLIQHPGLRIPEGGKWKPMLSYLLEYFSDGHEDVQPIPVGLLPEERLHQLKQAGAEERSGRANDWFSHPKAAEWVFRILSRAKIPKSEEDLYERAYEAWKDHPRFKVWRGSAPEDVWWFRRAVQFKRFCHRLVNG